MTKKDYNAIAAIFRDSKDWNPSIPLSTARELLAEKFAGMLQADNSRFQRERFLSACRGEDSTDSAGRRVRYSRSAS